MDRFRRKALWAKIPTLAAWAILLVPFAVYAITIVRYMVNVPFWDDYSAVLKFLLHFTQTPAWGGKLGLVFSQHNEHRIVVDRLATLLWYGAFHSANFNFLTIFGNLGWIVTVVTILRYARMRLRFSALALVPIAFLLLSFEQGELMFWAMSAVQNYWCLFFVVVCLLLLAEGRGSLAAVFFPMALFTSGGAVVLYPLGNAYLLLKKDWRRWLPFALLSSLFLGLYFIHYHTPPRSPSLAADAVHPLDMAACFFTFMGNMFSPEGDALVAGLFMAGLAVFFVVRRQGDPFFRLLLCFVGLAALTVALTRSGLGPLTATASRYSPFSLLAAAALYVLSATSLPTAGKARKVFLAVMILLAVINWWDAFVRWDLHDRFRNSREERLTGMRDFAEGRPGGLCHDNQQRAAELLRASRDAGLYDFEQWKRP